MKKLFRNDPGAWDPGRDDDERICVICTLATKTRKGRNDTALISNGAYRCPAVNFDGDPSAKRDFKWSRQDNDQSLLVD